MLRLVLRSAASRPAVWFAVLAVLVLANLMRHWGEPILDRHEFRQTQTALAAHWLREEGWRLDYPLPVFGPPWSAPMEFPLYQEVVAVVAKATGCSIEAAGRAVAIAAFFAALPALAGLLASAGFGVRTRWIVLGAVLLTPVYLFYARTVLIETTALCLALWFLHAYVRGLAGEWRWVGAAAVFGALAAVVKITTFLACCGPAAAWAALFLWRARQGEEGAARRFLRPLAAGVVPAVVAAAAGWWWVGYSDTVKASNPLAVRLQSANLHSWNFGTLAQRLDPEAWQTFARQTGYTTCGVLAGVLALLGLFFVPRRHRLVALAAGAAFLVGPLWFFNLYLVHDYYFCANAVFLAVALGLVAAGLGENPRVPRFVAVAAALLLGGLQLHGFRHGLGTYFEHEVPAPPALAAAVRAAVPEEGVVLLMNRGWNPQLPFYMQRRAVMAADGFLNDVAALGEVVARLEPGTLCALVWRGSEPIPLELHAFVFDELGFDPEPVAYDGENTLFLREGEAAAARLRLASLGLPGLRRTAPVLTSWPAAGDFRTFPAPLPEDNPLCRPAPFSGRSLYGFSLGRNGGRDCIVAHAPSRLVVAPPDGAATVELAFGLADECIHPESSSDGVVVAVFLAQPDRTRRMLFQRTLDPVANPADRGIQVAGFELPPGAGGTLVLEANTGVSGNSSFDWFYWYGIAVH